MSTIEVQEPFSVKARTAEMLSMIDGTHWTKENLACPIYPLKRVRIRDYSGRNASGYTYRTRPDYGRPPIKITYCLVGLAMKVTGFEPSIDEDHLLQPVLKKDIVNEEVARKKSKDFVALIDALATQLPEEEGEESIDYKPWKRDRSQARITQLQIGTLEEWNDDEETNKKDVRELVQRAHDAASETGLVNTA